MNKIILLLAINFSLLTFNCFAQDKHLVDSLETQLKNHNAKKLELKIKSPSLYDSTAANILNKLSQAYWGNNPDKSMDYAQQCLTLSEQIAFKKGIGGAYNSMGVINLQKGDYIPALEFHRKALKIRIEIGDKNSIAASYANTGNIYFSQGNYPEALKNFFASLKINEEVGDKRGLSISYGNIGATYGEQGNYPEALKNFLASLKIGKEFGDKYIIAGSYGNIGSTYSNQGNYPEALKNHFAALKIQLEIGDKYGVATTYNSIGNVYNDLNNYPEALKHHFAALKIKEEIGAKSGIAQSFNNIGNTYTKEKKYKEASQYLYKGLTLAKEIGTLETIKSSYSNLANLDSAQAASPLTPLQKRGEFAMQALEHYKLYIIYRDSLLNNENSKKTVQMQMNYDFDKKQVADSLKFVQEKVVSEIKLQKQKAITYGGFIGIAITILLLFFVYRNYKKQHIANQKLKEAQEQLIKSERMAAFGVMASRVAHEILNPINFVNNFSQLSKDLVSEIVDAKTDAEKKEAAKILIENIEKINHHGKRADDIVKELFEHTRKGTAQEYFEDKKS